MKQKIVLIDGHSILNRAFYGVPMLTNSKGLHTNAIYGFLNIMFKILDEEGAEHLAVAFDLHAPTFRHKMYEAYKGTRKGMPDELREQVPVIKEVLAAMGICTIEQEGIEADDILGTLSKHFNAMGYEVSVISGDRDLLQLATDQVKIRIPKTKMTGTEIEDYYATDVYARYQVTPTEFIDLKALMGDASDNIPGVPGIGEKTAEKIIVQYHSIENAYAHADEIKPAKASENLVTYWEQAQLSKVLATIRTDCELAITIEETQLGNMYNGKAFELFKMLEFKNILSRFKSEDHPKVNIEAAVLIKDGTAAEKILIRASQADKLGLYYHAEAPRGLSLCFDVHDLYFIPECETIKSSRLISWLTSLQEKTIELCFLDLKPQLTTFDFEGFQDLFDCQLAAYLLNPLKDSYFYDDIARDYLALNLPSGKDLLGKKTALDLWKETPERFLEYIGWQSYVPWAARQIMADALMKSGMQTLYQEIELPLVFVLHSMEAIGIGVERESLAAYGEQLKARIDQLETRIHELAGEQFNINSPKQLGVILFEKLKLPYGKKTKTGYSTSAEILEKLQDEDPIIHLILEYRQLTKLKSTYADGLANYILDDQRIHGKFNQTITATGRISSTEPNLQNIPVRVELGRLIRKVFVPKDGYVFVDADYSQIELRVLAHMSDDEQLIKAYNEAQDIHRLTASQVFHVELNEVTDLQRRNAKAVNFGIVYGISSFGLSQDLSITRKEASDYIKQYFKTYPKIKAFLDQTVEDARTKGYAETIFGRRRPVPELTSSNFMQRAFGERIAMNSPIQGTAADIIKIAMIRVRQRLHEMSLKSRLILQVHDELLIETANDEVDIVTKILAEEMEHAATLKVALEVDVNSGKNWYEAK